jgi:hypothetical protein
MDRYPKRAILVGWFCDSARHVFGLRRLKRSDGTVIGKSVKLFRSDDKKYDTSTAPTEHTALPARTARAIALNETHSSNDVTP